ncbi:hypothetical protein [Novosphingobium sp. KA1]|uniref:hypothetical protein n=1 Tax=Novosphingobium sp. (strain KA1) TaxID=164608 RepID=UPI001A8C0F7B|nr:hypothetical protein [Novosphingobium sp. KA1]QSR19294.1 hypothetical protein CA833_19135 [Novosphingobium sp. KA1]
MPAQIEIPLLDDQQGMMVREMPQDALAINAVFEIDTLIFPPASCDDQASIKDRSMILKPIYHAPDTQ